MRAWELFLSAAADDPRQSADESNRLAKSLIHSVGRFRRPATSHCRLTTGKRGPTEVFCDRANPFAPLQKCFAVRRNSIAALQWVLQPGASVLQPGGGALRPCNKFCGPADMFYRPAQVFCGLAELFCSPAEGLRNLKNGPGGVKNGVLPLGPNPLRGMQGEGP
jgi:hypothetical protein